MYFSSSGVPQLAHVIGVHFPRLPVARAVNRVLLHRFQRAIKLVLFDVLPQLARAALQAEGHQAQAGALLEHGDDFLMMWHEVHLATSQPMLSNVRSGI